MLNYLHYLVSRKGKTPPGTTARRSSRWRRVCLTLEQLGERILLTAGSSIPPFIGPRLLGPDTLVPVSSNYDDPFVKPANVEWIDLADFDHGNGFGPTRLSGPRVRIEDESVISRLDPYTLDYQGPFAENPWPEPTTNRPGIFVFDEPRFPLLNEERGPDGQILLDQNGLQIWAKNDLHVGMTTAFEAANWVLHAAERWAGRGIPWGINGRLEIEPHAFYSGLPEVCGFYSPSAKSIFLSVFPYRLPGDQQTKVFESATSWEVDAHESGHALHHALKPNIDQTDLGFNTWGESFADQTEMWSSLEDPGRARALLQEVDGNLYRANSLTRFGEFFASLFGEGTAARNAFHNKTVSTTDDEVHDRSEVLTGAAYKIFYRVFLDLTQRGMSDFDALQQAGNIMGIFLMRSTDHTPEETVTLEDVGKAYLKVDKEYFGGRYHDILANEFRFREIFDDSSLAEFDAHEADLPQLTVQQRNPLAVRQLIQDNLDKLEIGPGFGLMLQGWTVDPEGRQIVRVQLTLGRGDDAQRLDNHGILVFRPDGSLMDYHSPLPSGLSPALALQRIHQAEQLGLDRHGAPLAITQAADGQIQVEARMLQGTGIHSFQQVFSFDHPNGQRRTLGGFETNELKALLPKGAVIVTAEDLQAAEKTTVDALFAAAENPGEGLPESQSSTGSSVRADFSQPGISQNMMKIHGDFLPVRSDLDSADGEAHKLIVRKAEPGGVGDGILPSALIDRLLS
jgi:hypothetical protein